MCEATTLSMLEAISLYWIELPSSLSLKCASPCPSEGRGGFSSRPLRCVPKLDAFAATALTLAIIISRERITSLTMRLTISFLLLPRLRLVPRAHDYVGRGRFGWVGPHWTL